MADDPLRDDERVSYIHDAVAAREALQLLHDLRGTLTPAVLMVEYAAEQCRSGSSRETIAQTLDDAREALLHAARLARASSTLSTPGREPTVTTVRNFKRTLHPDEDRLLLGPLVPDVPQMPAADLVRVLSNLVDNGLRACATSVRVSAARELDQIVLRVRDDGPGIDPAHQHDIFEMYWTDRPDGTGIGLFLCRELARHWEGHLTVSSMPGNTCFRLALPVLDRRGP